MTNDEFRNDEYRVQAVYAISEAGTMACHCGEDGVKIMRAVICLLAALVLALGAIAQNLNQSKNEDEQALRRIELEMARAEQQNDWSKIDAIIEDDWVGLGQKPVTKTEVELGIKHAAEEHGSQPYTVEKKNIRVDLFGDTGVVTYTKDYRQTADTSKVAHEDDTDVFTRTPQGWRLRFTKISPVPNPRSE